jgi:hypothetical protein
VLAIPHAALSPSALRTASASRGEFLSWLNGWPMRSPADASLPPLRTATHGSGPMWVATPSSQWICTTYSLPVSRRTRSENEDGLLRVAHSMTISPTVIGVGLAVAAGNAAALTGCWRMRRDLANASARASRPAAQSEEFHFCSREAFQLAILKPRGPSLVAVVRRIPPFWVPRNAPTL